MKLASRSLVLIIALFYANLINAQETTISLDLGVKKYVGKISKLKRDKYFGIQTSYANKDLQEEAPFLFETLQSHPAKNFGGPEINGNLSEIQTNKIDDLAVELKKEIGKNPIFSKYGSSDFLLTQEVPFKVYDPSADADEGALKMVEYIKNLFPKLPKYYEIMDDPYGNVNLFSDSSVEGKVQIASFYKTVAKTFKEELPEVKVGGYDAPRPLFELNNFKNWEENYKVFLDIAGEDIDFISTKLYDELDKDTATLNYCSGSNSEAILDLMDTYSYSKWNQLKPHIISEYGLKVPEWEGTNFTPQYSTYTVQSLNNFVMSFIDKPNAIEKAIPYILGKNEKFYSDTRKNPKSNPHPMAILRKDGEGNYVYTDLVKFYEFWSDINGDRVYISSNNPDIQVNSFYSKGKWHIICNNLSSKVQTLNFGFTNNDILKISNYTLRRLFADEEGILELTEASTDLHIDQLEIDPNEIFMLTCNVPDQDPFATSIVEYNNYSKDYLKSIEANKPSSFKFSKVVTGKGKANLRVSFGRPRGADMKPVIKLNGEYVLTPTNWAGYDQSNKDTFFGTLVVPIPMSYLKEQNEVTVSFADNGGKLSSVVINTEIFSEDVNNENYVENNTPVFSSHGGNLLNISPAIECRAPKIVNNNGKVVKKLKFYSNGETIDISSLGKGDYILETSNGGRYKFKK